MIANFLWDKYNQPVSVTSSGQPLQSTSGDWGQLRHMILGTNADIVLLVSDINIYFIHLLGMGDFHLSVWLICCGIRLVGDGFDDWILMMIYIYGFDYLLSFRLLQFYNVSFDYKDTI